MKIPSIDANALFSEAHSAHSEALSALHDAATETGFFTVYNVGIGSEHVEKLLAIYKAFFMLPENIKAQVI